MDLMVERCAGVDIGKDEVVACVRTPDPIGRGRRKETRTFRSFTSQLEAMADWFASEGVTEVVMEATGSYWKSPWYVLEERGFDLKLVNVRHVGGLGRTLLQERQPGHQVPDDDRRSLLSLCEEEHEPSKTGQQQCPDDGGGGIDRVEPAQRDRNNQGQPQDGVQHHS
jgi:hypothetical protein